MKRILTIILFVALASTAAIAQPVKWVASIDTVHVVSEREWANDTIRYHYNQMKYYVTTILPYLNAATEVFKELDETLQDPTLNKKQKKAIVKSKEQVVKQRFEEEVKQLNETQGVYLVKLITRQTGANIYHILKEFKNPLTAVKWQGWAKLHGFNLNKRYNPEDEPWLEDIMEDLGYPLPASN